MLSRIILQSLVHSPTYWRKVLPYLKPEYFDDPADRLAFESIARYASKYNAPPTIKALMVEMDDGIGMNEALAESCTSVVSDLESVPEIESEDWLVDKTESFCQEMAIQNALRKSIGILDGREKNLTKGMIPDLLHEALAISFDTHVGHDYLKDWEVRWEEMHRESVRIPFDIQYLNKITKGGIYQKTLTCFMAQSGVGKSITMCHMAAANLAAGLNVMYVSCEMSELRLAERIDMNLLDMTDEDLAKLTKDQFKARLDRAKSRMKVGRLIFKEYPTSSVGAAHVKHLLSEAKTKQGFVPDILYVDYLNIMISTKVRDRSNTYALVKTIAEEVRGLAVEFNIPVVTATQVNRGAYNSSDISMENTSESMGLVHTLDLFLALIQTEELADQNQVLVKQLKNRYRDENRDRKFVVGMDKSKMRLYDVESSAQKGLNQGTTTTDQPQRPIGFGIPKVGKNVKGFS